MPRSLLIVWVFATIATTALAGEPCVPGDRTWLPIQEGVARFRLSFGRLHVDRLTSFSGRKQSVEYVDGVRESYSVSHVADGVRAEYERVRPNVDRTSFLFDGDGSFRLVEESLEEGSEARSTRRVELVQPAEGWMTLSVETSEGTRSLRAPTIWHMYLRDPELCRAYVVPALADLHIAADVDGIGSRLAELAKEGADLVEPAPRDETLGWIHDLSDPSFQVRRTADEQLRAMGPALVAWIRLFPVDRLDREQRDRLREMVATLEASSDDRADRVAIWLANDPWIWGELLARGDDATKATAVERIEALTGEAVTASADATLAADDPYKRTRELCQQERRSLR